MARLSTRVDLVRKEIELVRQEMGKPRSNSVGIVVTGAHTHEVFFGARNLFERANRLSFEITREKVSIPDIPVGEILPFDVAVVVTAALLRMRAVKSSLSIPEQTVEPATVPVANASDVFLSTLEADRALDRILDNPPNPSDVFQKVTLAVGYAARILARFPGQKRIPEAPAFQRHKTPADVYRRLLGCLALVHSVAENSHLEMLEIHTGDRGLGWVTSGDTYDLASLLVAELAYIHTRIRNAEPPRHVYYPGRKFPSHVYQRAGIIEIQLRDLARRVARNPRWLESAGND